MHLAALRGNSIGQRMPRLSKNNKGLQASKQSTNQHFCERGLARAKRGDDRLREFFRASLAAYILGDVFALAVYAFESAFDPPRGGPFA